MKKSPFPCILKFEILDEADTIENADYVAISSEEKLDELRSYINSPNFDTAINRLLTSVWHGHRTLYKGKGGSVRMTYLDIVEVDYKPKKKMKLW